MSARLVGSTRSRPLVGNFEENVLNNRLEPIRTIEGYTAEVRASCNLVQPKPLRSKVRVNVFSLDDSFPYLGQVDLNSRKYKLPKKGTLQVTLFNPNGTLVKLWLLKYDLTEMPPSSQTFLRQKTLLLLKQTTTPPQPIILNSYPLNRQSQDQNQYQSSVLQSTSQPIGDITTTNNLNSSQKLRDYKPPITKSLPHSTTASSTKRRIKYMIQFNIVSSKSGHIYLNKDLRIFVSKKVDLETASQFTKQDYELKSFDEMPNNPRYFSR
uniref:Protein FAM214A n=1 Tax=Aceria tosichella TaxID=561515 RepID=A0A6G1S4U7_9ACAR